MPANPKYNPQTDPVLVSYRQFWSIPLEQFVIDIVVDHQLDKIPQLGERINGLTPTQLDAQLEIYKKWFANFGKTIPVNAHAVMFLFYLRKNQPEQIKLHLHALIEANFPLILILLETLKEQYQSGMTPFISASDNKKVIALQTSAAENGNLLAIYQLNQSDLPIKDYIANTNDFIATCDPIILPFILRIQASLQYMGLPREIFIHPETGVNRICERIKYFADVDRQRECSYLVSDLIATMKPDRMTAAMLNYFKKSASQGHRPALYALACAYLDGKWGAEKNENQALVYLNELAEHQLINAYAKLGQFYRKQPDATAVYFFRQALQLNQMKQAYVHYLSSRNVAKNLDPLDDSNPVIRHHKLMTQTVMTSYDDYYYHFRKREPIENPDQFDHLLCEENWHQVVDSYFISKELEPILFEQLQHHLLVQYLLLFQFTGLTEELIPMILGYLADESYLMSTDEKSHSDKKLPLKEFAHAIQNIEDDVNFPGSYAYLMRHHQKLQTAQLEEKSSASEQEESPKILSYLFLAANRGSVAAKKSLVAHFKENGEPENIVPSLIVQEEQKRAEPERDRYSRLILQ
jgi:TPR repeat protein